MASYSKQIKEYWDSIFQSNPAFINGDEASIVVNDKLDGYRELSILNRLNGHYEIALTSEILGILQLKQGDAVSMNDIRNKIKASGLEMHDPDYLFYPEREKLLSVNQSEYEIRQLTEADQELFADFQAAASAEDLGAAYVELDHWLVFGGFSNGRLVCAASMYPWDSSKLADIGILTLEDCRGKGYGKRLVHAIGHQARTMGYELQYRCQMDNEPSVNLARAAGLSLFGTWQVLKTAD